MTAIAGIGGTAGGSHPLPRTGLLGRLLSGRAEHARWERPALLALLLLTAVLYIVNLSVSGWANSFYSAAAQAGSVNWEAFFYGSSDAANSITVDKPPASLWLMALSVRVFGLSSFAVLLPEALLGVATVAVLYATVRRRFPAPTALLAGFILAVTPVAALMFRFNNPDALLVLLSTLACYFVLRGVETGAIRWVIWAGVMIGLGFLTKQLQAFLILPVLAGVYLYAAPKPLLTRIGHSLAALGAVVLSAGWWVAIVELVPASMRPYIGGSQNNDFLELTFGYNGFGRLDGQETGSVTGGSPHWGYTGIDRLFSGDIGAQVTWLMFAALVTLGIGLWLMRRLPRTAASRATLLLLGGTLVLTALAFSFMAGIFHPYYTVAFAPALAGTVAIGAGMLWSRRAELWSRIVMSVLVLGSALWAWELFFRTANWLPWLQWLIVGLGTAAAVLLMLTHRGRRVSLAAASLALLAVLLGPTAFTLATIAGPHTGSVPTAGPQAGTARAVIPGALTPHRPTIGLPGGQLSATHPAGPAAPLSAPAATGGLLDAATVAPSLAAALSENASRYTWLAAAVGSNRAAGFQLATGLPVMPLGGFNGSDPSPTLDQFQAIVTSGRIHWFIPGTVGASNGGSRSAGQIANWVANNFSKVTLGTVTFYDLTAPLA